MQTTYYPDDLLVVPELTAFPDPFETLTAFVAQKRRELEVQGRGTTLRRIALTRKSLRRLAEDPAFRAEAKRGDPSRLRMNLAAEEILGEILGVLVEVVEPGRP